MTRLLVHVEGQTEEDFVNEILRPHLHAHGYSAVGARLVGNARQRDRRGGIKAWSVVKDDLVRHLTEDRESIATTMVDYYALPQSGSKAWPGRAASSTLPHPRKAASIEALLLDDVADAMGAGFDRRRFVPFVLMHEFEALLFSDCAAFGKAIVRPELVAELQAVRDQFDSPEEINDSPQTAPSKRVEGLITNYQKPLFGVLAALEIGLPAMRAECTNFSAWLSTLESLPTTVL